MQTGEESCQSQNNGWLVWEKNESASAGAVLSPAKVPSGLLNRVRQQRFGRDADNYVSQRNTRHFQNRYQSAPLQMLKVMISESDILRHPHFSLGNRSRDKLLVQVINNRKTSKIKSSKVAMRVV